MPWEIRKSGDRHCVYKKGESSPLHCYDTEHEAQDYLAALYANEPGAGKAMDNEFLICFGGAVKALGEGRIGGLLAPYGSPDALDLEGDFFTQATDFGLELPARVNLYYNHGLDPEVGREKLGRASLKATEEGVWFEAELKWLDEQRDKARRYKQLVYRLAEEGALGASSGAAPHVVTKRPAAKGREVLDWPIAEASVSPTPMNPATVPTVSALKSLLLPSLEEAALKALGEDPAASRLPLTADLARVREELLRVTERGEDRLAFRLATATKAGRMLSQANMDELRAILGTRESLIEMFGRVEALLKRAEPKPEEDESPLETGDLEASRRETDRLHTDFLRLQSRRLGTGPAPEGLTGATP